VYNFDTFYRATVADWQRCEMPDRDPDFISFTGSAYWCLKNKVRRYSDHWGVVMTCRWTLEGEHYEKLPVCAQCYYEDFWTVGRCEYDPARILDRVWIV